MSGFEPDGQSTKILSLPPPLAFTESDAVNAWEWWGCNCGPTALACCAGLTLDAVRPVLPEFPARRYVNVTMMREAIARLGLRQRDGVDWPVHGLLRIQWTGPWTAPGANGRWAATHTHWVASKHHAGAPWVFDVNGGWLPAADWETEIVPLIVGSIKRADGGWRPTHRWEIRRQLRMESEAKHV